MLSIIDGVVSLQCYCNVIIDYVVSLRCYCEAYMMGFCLGCTSVFKAFDALNVFLLSNIKMV